MINTIQKRSLILAHNTYAKAKTVTANGCEVVYLKENLNLPKFVTLNKCKEVPIGFISVEELGFEMISNTTDDLAFKDSRNVFIIQYDDSFTVIFGKKTITDIKSVTELQNSYFSLTGKELNLKD